MITLRGLPDTVISNLFILVTILYHCQELTTKYPLRAFSNRNFVVKNIAHNYRTLAQ